MKTLSGTLLAAQQARVRTPFVKAEASDFRGDVRRLRWGRWYSGADADAPIAAVVAADGALVRWRNNAGSLDFSRVATPGPMSTWTSWTTTIETAQVGTDVALVRLPSGLLWGFFVETDHSTIERIQSADDGATFPNTNTAVVTAGNDRDRLAAAVNPSGEVMLIWSEGADVRWSRWDGATWSAPATWTNTIADCTGLAIAWSADWQVMVTGLEDTTLRPTVWAVRLGDGFSASPGTWGALRVVTQASADALVQYMAPAISQGPVLGAWRCFFVEAYGGNARLQMVLKVSQFDFDVGNWQDYWPFDYEGNGFGVAVARDVPGTGVYLAASDGVWASRFVPPTVLDLGADVVAVDITVDVRGARGRVELDNAGGGYSSFGAGGLEALQPGARLVVMPGYSTAAGDEVATSSEYGYVVEACELVSGPRPRLVLHVRGPEIWLERWRARRHYEFAAGGPPVATIAFTVGSASGIAIGASGSTSAAWSSLAPGWLVQPGERGDQALDRLLTLVPEAWRGHSHGIAVVELSSGDSAVYTFGVAHAILEGRYGRGLAAANRVRVLGEGALGDAFDFAAIEVLGEALQVVADRRVDDAGVAADRAAVTLRDAQLEAETGEIDVPVHCGLELYDVVSVTDAGAGLVAAPRRVRGFRWRVDRLKGLYEMTVRLGAV